MKFIRPVTIASYRKLVGYQAGLLAGTCALVAALILIGNTVTSEQIKAMEKADRLQMLGQVIPENLHDNDLLADQLKLLLESDTSNTTEDASEPDHLNVYLAKSDNKLSGIAFPVTAQGYGGDINLIVGVNGAGEILGVRVINHKETPGLGDKIEIARDSWITDFDGLSLANTPANAWEVKKDGGQFDQFTGATITPRAIVRAVYQGLVLISEQQHAINTTLSKEGKTANQKQSQPSQSAATVAAAYASENSNKTNSDDNIIATLTKATADAQAIQQDPGGRTLTPSDPHQAPEIPSGISAPEVASSDE